MRVFKILLAPHRMLTGEDGAYTWANKANSDEASLTMPGAARGLSYNVFADLDDSAPTWTFAEPVDPTEYYGSDVGKVVGNLY